MSPKASPITPRAKGSPPVIILPSRAGLDGDSIDQYQTEGGDIGSTQLCRELEIT